MQLVTLAPPANSDVSGDFFNMTSEVGRIPRTTMRACLAPLELAI